MISFNAKASADEAKKHEDFVTRMVAKGYTPKQVRLLCEWYLQGAQEFIRQGGRGPCCSRSSTADWRERTSRSATASGSCAATRSRSVRR